MTSVRPVNRLLGFGMRGMTPSDVVLLLLWMCICPRSTLSFGSPEHLPYNYSTHRVSSNERVVASNKVVSTCKNARSAHVMRKVKGFRMRECTRKVGKESARTLHIPIVTVVTPRLFLNASSTCMTDYPFFSSFFFCLGHPFR
jgi:hypothetical protein